MGGLDYACDVAVIGGSMGGVAAALAAADAGCNVLLTSGTDWLGGQMTSQGVSALDEHRYIESFGGTSSYYRMRDAVRAWYQAQWDVPASMPDGRALNPGNGWVSALCFEPRVGAAVLEEMLRPYVEGGRLLILREHTPVAASTRAGQIREVVLRRARGEPVMRLHATYYLDATDLGDLLPLVDAGYATGAEAQAETGEAHARAQGPRPEETQGFTYCFAVEYRPGEDHTIPRPRGYAQLRGSQPYTFVLRGHDGEPRPFRVFSRGPTDLPPFWTYRRLLDGELLGGRRGVRDVAMVNWSGNDYHGASLIDKPRHVRARILEEAQRLALGFLYWLQTEAPRDDGSGHGYPGLRLLPSVMGTRHGLSKQPYIRESRRIRALQRVVEGEIAAEGRTGARAARFADAVGIGWYAMDLHDCVGNPTSMFAPTLPFQIPLGALIPVDTGNLLAACKNIGTTHLTNGAYRLHPIEWNIGESAGTLAAYCCATGHKPSEVWAQRRYSQRLQYQLLKRGVPVAWSIDVPQGHDLFLVAQMLVAWGAVSTSGTRYGSLALEPNAPLTPDEARSLIGAGLALVRGSARERADEARVPAAQPVASREDVEQLLRENGLPVPALAEPPGWGEVAAVFAPLMERTLGELALLQGGNGEDPVH